MVNIEIYTTPGCGYSTHVKRLLDSHGLKFIEHDVYNNPQRLQELRSRTDRRSYPQVFINGGSIGGFEELLLLEQQQRLPKAGWHLTKKLLGEYHMSNINLYRHALSGHSHRVEVFLSLLGLEANIIDVDLAAGAHKSPEFLAKNAFGQLPVLEDNEVTLADSNAILVYLATKYDTRHQWLPNNAVEAAEVQRFLSVAAGKIATGPAVARLVNVFGAGLDHQAAIDTAHSVLSVLEQHLQGREWLVNDHATLADVANYTYIAHAPEGDVALDDYPNIRDWLNRFEALEGFVPMQATAVGLSV